MEGLDFTPDTTPELISLLAGVLLVISLSIYVVRLIRGASIPNPATWGIWLLVGLINLVTYLHVVRGNLSNTIVIIVANLGVAAITGYSFFKGRFSPLGLTEKISLVLALFVGIIWQLTGNPILANLILQVVYIISFIPTVVGLARGEIKETPLPWVLAVVSYTLMTVPTFLHWSAERWVELAHPLINGIFGNGLVAYYSLRGSKKVC